MKKTLSMEAHFRLAGRLRRISLDLGVIQKEISGHGLGPRVGQKVFAVDRKLAVLKSVLDDVLFRDHPDDPRATPEVYYGATTSPAEDSPDSREEAGHGR